MRARLDGPEHPRTLAVWHELARMTGAAGDPGSARDMFAELLPVRGRLSCPDHPDTLTTHANLAGWTGEAGDPIAARDMFAELLPVRERTMPTGPARQETQAPPGIC
jgi:hypothetical protein